MSGLPPVQFAEYPRSAPADPEAAAKLQALSDGYFNLSYLFLLHMVGMIASFVVAAEAGLVSYLVWLAAVSAAAFWFGLKLNKKVGYGLGWSSSLPAIAAVSYIVIGFIGYAVVQTMAASGMKEMGVRRRFFGIRKKDIKARIAELTAS
jgi:hypothetical protein